MSFLTVRLFGPPRIELNGVALDLDHRKPLALLAYLAVTGIPHSRESLAALLWPDYPNARTYLRNNLYIMRRALGGSYDDWIALDRQAVEWRNADSAWADVNEFEDHVAAFRSHEHPNNALCSTCIDHLSKAVTLADNEFLAGFTLRDSPPFDEWVYFQRAHLQAENVVALDALAAHYGKAGNFGPAIEYARGRLALDNLNEPAHRQLMTFFARNNQFSLALHQYEECVRLLRVELDVEPAAETRSLLETIRRRSLPETTLSQAFEKDESQAQSIATIMHDGDDHAALPPNNLPAPLTSLIGRQREVASLCGMLTREEIRLLTLTGPGGVGKTRLSLAVAADALLHFADGVYFVALAPVRRPALLPSVIATTLGIPAAPERSIMETLAIALGNKRMLLVLDNFEHILSIAPVVTELLHVCPRLTVLATSREALHLTGEHEIVVHPLAVPEPNGDHADDELAQLDAVQLFAQRARQAQGEFLLDENSVPIATQICRRLDGLPLAIELAAARTKHFTLPALLTQLNGASARIGHEGRALPLLKDAKRDVPARHQSLRTAIAWSYDLLTVEEQALFRRLSVFVGGWTVEAAQAICLQGLTLDIWEGLSSLLDKSLIRRTVDGSAEPRFAMLETLREFGLEQLRVSQEEKSVRSRMLAHTVVAVEDLNAKMMGPNFTEDGESMRREYGNIRVVLDWAFQEQNVDACLRLCNALRHFWNGYPLEAAQAIEAALKLAHGTEDTVGYATLLVSAGYFSFLMGNHDIAYRRFQQSLEMNERVNESNSSVFVSIALGLSATVLFYRGEYGAAESYYRKTIVYTQSVGDEFSLAMSETNLGTLLTLQGKFDQAEELIEQGLQRHRSIGQAWGITKSLGDLGLLHVLLGRYSAAAQILEECLSLAEQHRLGDRVAVAKEKLALLAIRKADFSAAAALLADAVTARHQRGGKLFLINVIENVVELAVCTQQYRNALHLAGATTTHRSLLGITVAPIPGATLTRAIEEARNQLSPEASVQAWNEGSTMSLDNATDLAIQVCRSI